ncbi:acyl--CoA ligase [Ectothiorhodospiraceae bacterium WFHF3C12]|nr:acyl--CoA ligase [Ectothiorhodospiraceae bacterium WFHF3C12]
MTGAAVEQRFATRRECHFGDRVMRCFVNRPESVQAMLAAAVETNPQGDAFVYEGERISYRALGEIAARVAANLADRGVSPGDRVTLVLRNGPAFMYALLGTLWLGGIAVPVNAREQGAGIGHIVADCTASAVIIEPDLLERLEATEAGRSIGRVFVDGDGVGAAEPFAALLGESASPVPVARPAEADTAVILYTSGTTGTPKGAMQTHLNITHSVIFWERCMGLRRGERSLLAVPASHVTGLMAIVFSMIRMAGCTVLMREFDAGEFNRLAAEERVNSTVMVPAMYKLCLMRANFDEVDLSAWRTGCFGGAPMPEATILEFRERLPHLELMNAYGATETCTVVTAIPPARQLEYLDSIGKVVDCVDILVMDEHGREMPPGETGELWIAGPVVIPGYWGDPDRTAEAFVGGYWRSGDIGSKDAAGFVRLHDRKKDLVIRGGYNVYSIEVENAIAYHEGVAECAVVGEPDPVLGEKIHAFVSVTDPSLDEARIREFCASRLADYKVPDRVTLQSAPLPRNANGKVIKRDLRVMLADGG